MQNNEVDILLVEDNQDDIELTMSLLKKNNITDKIKVVRDGDEALEYLFGSVDGNILRENPPEMILLDLKLPKVNGLEVLKRIKTHPRASKIPIIIFTSSSEDENLLGNYILDVNAYIRKPIGHNEFSDVVRQIELQWLLAKEKTS